MVFVSGSIDVSHRPCCARTLTITNFGAKLTYTVTAHALPSKAFPFSDSNSIRNLRLSTKTSWKISKMTLEPPSTADFHYFPSFFPYQPTAEVNHGNVSVHIATKRSEEASKSVREPFFSFVAPLRSHPQDGFSLAACVFRLHDL